jgi:ferric-dicitrate binding protein FerR (iron transport regulator)
MSQEDRVAQLLLDDSFLLWIKSGKPAADRWSKRLAADPLLQSAATEAESLVHTLKFRSDDINPDTLRRIKEAINTHHHDFAASVQRRPDHLVLRWAAVVAFVAVAAFALAYFLPKPSAGPGAATYITKAAHNGQKLTVYLPDGSQVKLNSRSKIQYEEGLQGSVRRVWLWGEAFFDVSKDLNRPFEVVCGDLLTKALGTSFNIDASHPDTICVSLASGKVMVRSAQKSTDTSYYLSPGEQLLFSTSNEEALLKKAKMDDVLAWTEGKIIFKEAGALAVFSELEQWYGVQFVLEENPLDSAWHYTGAFSNESLYNVLTSIGHVKKFHFQIENETVYIFKK